MCLVLLAWQPEHEYPIVLAANRDEYHARPSAAVHRWHDTPQVMAGRDLQSGGTWLGVAESETPAGPDAGHFAARFAVVTNIRERPASTGGRSRGELTADFLKGSQSAADYMHTLAGLAPDVYGAYNLIVGDGREVWYHHNRGTAPLRLAPGIYGLSNRFLDTPWPKLTKARERFSAALATLPEETAIFEALADREIVEDEALPETGVPLVWERRLSAIFVLSPDYGTRASTLLTIRAGGGGTREMQQIQLLEKSFTPEGYLSGESCLETGL